MNITINDRVVGFLTTHMIARDMSVNALAKQMGESQATLHRALNGEVAITFERVYNICKALDLDMKDVVEFASTPLKKKKVK